MFEKKKMLCWTSVKIHCTRCSLFANKEDTMVQIQTLWVIILLKTYTFQVCSVYYGDIACFDLGCIDILV